MELGSGGQLYVNLRVCVEQGGLMTKLYVGSQIAPVHPGKMYRTDLYSTDDVVDGEGGQQVDDEPGPHVAHGDLTVVGDQLAGHRVLGRGAAPVWTGDLGCTMQACRRLDYIPSPNCVCLRTRLLLPRLQPLQRHSHGEAPLQYQAA